MENKFRSNFKILRAVSALMASILWSHGGDVVLQRELSNRHKITVFRSNKQFSPGSNELRGLLEQWAKEWNQTNQLIMPSNESSYIELTVAMTTPSGQQTKLGWKHGYFDMIKYAGSSNDLKAFDVGLAEETFFICYKEGPVLCVEEIPQRSSEDGRMLVWLVRDDKLQLHTTFTNAAFFSSTNGQTMLKAQGSAGVELVWKYRGQHWELDLPRCKPERAKVLAENSHMIFEAGHWVRKTRATNSLPNQNGNNPKR